jgi:ABC-type uncharacterized transport system ATPase subunit
MAAAPLLTISDISKRFGALQALDHVSLTIEAGEVHCLLGENGAGKSTLCNILFGVYRADEGEMRLGGLPHQPSSPADALRHGIAMVHQHFSLVPNLSVVDNLLLGQTKGLLRRAECAERVASLSRQYGLTLQPRALVQDLSVGERQRVEIVKCLMREPRLLVLDEPTAVLLPDEIKGLLTVCEKVASEGCTIVLVTHKLAEVRRAAHRATVLRAGRAVARSDHPADDIELLVRAMIQRDLAQMGSVAASVVEVVEEERDGSRENSAGSTEPVALQVRDLVVRDDQGVQRLQSVCLSVRCKEIVGIAGVEGNGQSELGAILAGMTEAASGSFEVDGQDLTKAEPRAVTDAGVGIVPEDRHLVGCVAGMNLAENLYLNQLDSFKRWGLIDRRRLNELARARMSAFDVRATGPEAVFSSLSGGNQQKAVLARELGIPKLKVLIAAQPTRGLDVGAVEAIYGHIRAAAASGVGVLLISSELDELLGVADRILVMYRGRIMGECPARPDQRARIGALMAGHDA